MKKLKKELEEKSGRELAAICVQAALDTKAEDLVILDVRGLASFTDYFVIMSGRSSRHVQGLAEAIEERMRSKRVTGRSTEGLQEGLWVLLDYYDVVVHVFYHESRTFYDLEGLWHDAKRLSPEDLLAAPAGDPLEQPAKPVKRPLLLAILDGWGVAPAGPTNAVSVADTPHMDAWSAAYPCTSLTAHDGAVGLPEGQMGNSEVGHLNIGAGRVVYQDFTRINMAVRSGELARNPVLTTVLQQVSSTGGRLHLLGLLSDGGVHSHIEHLEALLAMSKEHGVQEVYVHCFMDGRDTPPKSGAGYMHDLEAAITRSGAGRVGTVCGRYFAMDRDKRWDRVEKAWRAMVHGEGHSAPHALAAVESAYARGETDEFIEPTVVLGEDGGKPGLVRDGDALIFFNFRADRVRELCHVFGDADFDSFDLAGAPELLTLVTMTEYEADFTFPVAFPPVSMQHILGEEISRHGMEQLRIAETEKYAHVTYFFNGGEEEPFRGEDRILIESPRDVATYDLKPEMSAAEVTDRLLEALDRREAQGTPYDLVILNFANGDMVGHSGVLPAAVQACEAVDHCLGRIRKWMASRDGVMLITADHGNAEMMVDPETGQPHTAHTLNQVPFLVVGDRFKGKALRREGALRDIAPTILGLLNLPVPEEMTGTSLIVP